MPITALDNVSLMETILSKDGRLVTEPSPAARSFFADKRRAVETSPAARSTFFLNAFLPWLTAFENPREWDSYTDRVAARQTKYGATSIMLDAHGLPGSVQNNPNDPQNELRLSRYRPEYRQEPIFVNRDEFTPVTIDASEILRLFAEGGPDSTNVSDFAAAQITQAVNADRSREFHTLMLAIGEAAERPNLYHVQIPTLGPGATEEDAREFAIAIRTAVLALADFTPFFTPAGNYTTVPKEQVRLIIRQSAMQRVGALGYSTAFNPEYVFALPQDQIVELPDHYFDRLPGLGGQSAVIVDRGNDQQHGSIVVVDTFHDWGVDTYHIKSSENRALHHASILSTNPFKAFLTVGPGEGTQVVNPQIVPATITGTVYGPTGEIVNGGDLVRGQQYSTKVAVLDASGHPAGGWLVSITSTGHAPGTEIGMYNTLRVSIADTASEITVEFTSIANPEIKTSRTYTLTGQPFAADGSGMLVVGSAAPVFAAGSGSGGTITYTTATGEVAEISTDNGATWNAASASPIAVPSGQTRRFRKRTAAGYVYPSGAGVKMYGPWTAA